jgi:hypothetical protein
MCRKHDPYHPHGLYTRCRNCGVTMTRNNRNNTWRVSRTLRTRIFAGPVWEYFDAPFYVAMVVSRADASRP